MHSISTYSPDHVLDSIRHSDTPFALVKKKGDDVQLFQGPVCFYDRLNDIRQVYGVPNRDVIDTIGAVPFHVVRERGFEAHSDGERISMLDIQTHARMSLDRALTLLPAERIGAGTPVADLSDAAYADVVRRIQRDEIGNGEGSNFVIANAVRLQIDDMSRAKALSIFRRLLETEFGAYMHFLYYDGDRYLVGASPERHLSVRKGEVTMNPISGTFRKEGRKLLQQFKEDLLKFLGDEKEMKELFKVLDEELKMMSEMCEGGGCVIGPLLKEMLRVIHAEYELVGHTRKRIIDLLRMSMFAPTVIGGPVRNACRIASKYEGRSRGFYAGALTMFGRDAEGRETLDSGILIRMAEIMNTGLVTVRAGATIVQDSNPESEAQEGRAKRAGILGAITDESPPSRTSVSVPADLLSDPDLHVALIKRNERLSDFSLQDQRGADLSVEALKNKKIVIIDNGDDFCMTLKHMITRMGACATVVSYDAYDATLCPSDVVLIGPGPGDPNDERDPKMQKVFAIVSELRSMKRPMLGVCLGHQIIARSLGLRVAKKTRATQGEQSDIDLFGAPATVGSYNTFAARESHIQDFDFASDPETGDVHAMRGPGIEGMQFHPESVLTKDGFRILASSLARLVDAGQCVDHSDTRSIDGNTACDH